MRSLDAGTARHERRGLVAIVENLTISFPASHVPGADCQRGPEAARHMRLIVALTAGLTVVLLILPLHP
jgi:hypothetical protein